MRIYPRTFMLHGYECTYTLKRFFFRLNIHGEVLTIDSEEDT